MTSRLRIEGVSRFPSRSRSESTLATMPDELTQQTPPSRIAGGRLPAEQEPGGEAGDEVRDGVEQPWFEPAAQAAAQLVGRVLEPEREQEQQHPDLGDDGDEVLADVEVDEPALAHREAGEQVEGDRRDAETPGETGQDREAEHDGTDLDERQRRLGAGRRDPGSRPDEGAQLGQPVRRADDDDNVAGLEPLVGAWRRDRRGASEHGDDRRARPRPELAVGDRRTDERRRRRQREPLDRQPFDLLLHRSGRLAHLGGTEELRQGLGVRRRQVQPSEQTSGSSRS